jgi:hypothetical protein
MVEALLGTIGEVLRLRDGALVELRLGRESVTALQAAADVLPAGERRPRRYRRIRTGPGSLHLSL